MNDNPWDEVYIEVEEVVDENPDLYIRRAEEALKERRYTDVLKECDQALRYSNHGLEYLCQKLRILFTLQRYSDCVRVVLSSNLWNGREELSASSKEDMFQVFAKSYRKCKLPIERIPIIILTDDGEGMCDTLQEAINRCNKNQSIYLTTGTYQQSIEINRDICMTASEDITLRPTIVNDEEKYVIVGEGKEISISNIHIKHNGMFGFDDFYGALMFKDSKVKMEHCSIDGDAHGLLTDHCQIAINECCITVQHMFLYSINKSSGIVQNTKYYSKMDCKNAMIDRGNHTFENCIFNNLTKGLNISDSEVRITKCQFNGGSDSTCLGAFIYTSNRNSSKVDILDSNFLNCGLLIKSYAGLVKCAFSGGEYGILVDTDGCVDLSDCKIRNIRGRGISNRGQAFIMNCDFENNETGIYSCGRDIKIKKSRVKSNSETGIAIETDGSIDNCTIQRNKESGLLLGREIKINDCVIQGNVTCGIAICDGSTSIEKTKICDNGDAGVYAYGNSKAYLHDCMIYCNKCANAAVDDTADMEITDSSISSSSSYGVWAKNRGRCDLKKCEVFNNAEYGIALSDQGKIVPIDCNIHDNESIIGSLSGIRRFFTT